MSKIRSEKTKQEFVKLMEEHPEWRFWQTVRNFVIDKYNFIYASNKMPEEGLDDTWSWEEKYDD